MPNKISFSLFIISGPSAVGKNTVIDGVKKLLPEVEETISCTTRQKRPGEIDGTHYYFLTDEEFKVKIAADEFLETFAVHGRRYGTLKSEVERIQKNNLLPLAVLDVQGALYLKKHYPGAVLIFIKPDSWEELERRLRARDIKPEELELRLRNAQNELMQAKFFDFQVINHTGQLEKATAEVAAIIKNQ
ncbi:guanylate kinase [Candidatus Falkowbacteria bacterium CG10_big_fil_rev_8_21_14_0_10_43_11]|uniref:Guanylate kinase n=1 Tax=Candidatus Falkowbacteria bacterium CG10_big_fil_rev_8_21_14_0_10_43_11 TaxID=1974568 RepID=A0A2M6WM15_9BACT|nr:MAG: guanylate kinase [Candidatus Falkowbacteria bacterium CG10_big_fil_rev_8_21_14_0_10_43_11]